MNLLEYQNECSLIRYPFKDIAALLWSDNSSTGTLPNNIILDACLSVFDNSTGTIGLSSIVYDGQSWVLNFTGIADIAITIGSLTGINTLASRSSDNNKLLRLDIDVDALAGYFTSNNLLSGTYTFDSSNVICISCIKFLNIGVKEITLINTTPAGSDTILNITDTLNIIEGTNTQFLINNNTVTTNVSSGLGAGLFDGCLESGNQILTINNTPPDTYGNVFISTDNCYSLRTALVTDQPSLIIDNTCIPECVADSITSFANYINRVTNGALQLSNYALAAQTNYQTLLNNYYTNEDAKTAPQSPYLLAQSSTAGNNSTLYHNITYGIYSPSKNNTPASVSAGYAESLILVPNSSYIIQNNVKTVVSSPNISTRNLNANSVVYAGFVLAQDVNTINTGDPVNDVTIVLTSNNSISGYVLPLNPKTFNYNIGYTYTPSTGTKTINIVIDLIDYTQPTSSLTSLHITMPGTFSIARSTLMLNNQPVNLTDKGFNNQTINFSQTNRYILEITCDALLTGSNQITFTGTSGTGSASKTITISI